MRIMVITLGLVIVLTLSMICCEEAEEGVDRNNDIIVRNLSEYNLWIMIDGEQKGFCDNDGISRTMWDGIADGIHQLQAFRNENYTGFHCGISTNNLNDGDDFWWVLEKDGEYSGSESGNC